MFSDGEEVFFILNDESYPRRPPIWRRATVMSELKSIDGDTFAYALIGKENGREQWYTRSIGHIQAVLKQDVL